MKDEAATARVRALPASEAETVYIGIDIGKAKHVAGFVSTTLLTRHERFEGCPALVFTQSREGFARLVERIQQYATLEHCYILMERTGHYHQALAQYLVEMDVPVYLIHVQRRRAGLLKSDKRDALSLANHLYNQLEKGVQVADKAQLVRRMAPVTETATFVRGLVRHRYELSQEVGQRKNKLIAICDEVFPEMAQVFADPVALSALVIREHFPTPHAIATASLVDLRSAPGQIRHPTEAKLRELQTLAAESIGTKDVGRLRGLVFEQRQLIRELRLLQQHIAEIETEVEDVMQHSREGRILRSIPGVGPICAATALSAIGNIANFPNAAALKAYFGWAPRVSQSGTSFNTASLTHGGSRAIKQAMYLAAWSAVRQDNAWKVLYERLVRLKCSYDERTHGYKGKNKVIGRVAGQMISMMYALLKADQEALAGCEPGRPAPEPVLYDPEKHARHRDGDYKPLKPRALRPDNVVQMPRKHR